jgi:ABC-type sugar transport system ATPase subunit
VLLDLRHIQKRFGGVVALRDGNLSVNAGEVHLVLGENGAGKSTLMKIVAGMVERDSGDMIWRGEVVHLRRPSEAAAIGIAMVHQESLLAPHLTVAENIFLGREPLVAPGFVNRRRMIQMAGRLVEEHRFPLQADWRVERLSPAGKQLVEICRAIQHGSSLLIFDEPTSSLSGAETQEVFRIVGALRERGMGIVYITHRMEELRAVGERVTILRDGATVATGALSELSNDEIIRHMVGREVTALYEREPHTPGEELLRVEGLNAGRLLRDISFHVRAHEIVGLAGLIGAGRTELCQALFGLDSVTSGAIWIHGQRREIRSPREAVRAGLALIPEDRQKDGLATFLPVGQNMTIANLPAVSPRGFLNGAAEKAVFADYSQRLSIRAESARQLAGRLSGGNQQKVVISKWLFRGARVLLFDEPTRGIDIGAKREVFELMDRLAREGAGILMVSSEIAELLEVADRILVMRQGRISGELPRGSTQEEVMRYATMGEETA